MRSTKHGTNTYQNMKANLLLFERNGTLYIERGAYHSKAANVSKTYLQDT